MTPSISEANFKANSDFPEAVHQDITTIRELFIFEKHFCKNHIHPRYENCKNSGKQKKSKRYSIKKQKEGGKKQNCEY